MQFRTLTRHFFRKFWLLLLGIVFLVVVGAWYRFLGPGEFNSRAFKAYNTVWASVVELKRNPDNFDAALQAGLGYYNLTRLNQAEEYYQKALAIKPDSAFVWNNLGNTYRDMLRLDEAEAAYKKSISFAPSSPVSYLNLVNLYTIWPVDDSDRHPHIPTVLLGALDATNRDALIVQAFINYYDNIGDTVNADKYRAELQGRDEKDVDPPKPV
jgi:tetratricopeptide (TPR) repeat protein